VIGRSVTTKKQKETGIGPSLFVIAVTENFDSPSQKRHKIYDQNDDSDYQNGRYNKRNSIDPPDILSPGNGFLLQFDRALGGGFILIQMFAAYIANFMQQLKDFIGAFHNSRRE